MRRLWVAFGRLAESEDDEFAFAYHCGVGATRSYDRKRSTRACERRALPLDRLRHVERGFIMFLKAAGLEPRGPLGRWLTRAAWRLLRFRVRRLAAA